ncbi:MAG: HIT domain-containing protein [Cellvibrionaceae bacterium]
MFELDSRLAEDTYKVGELPLSLVLLFKDANYPWTILVPKRAKLREIYELDHEDRQQLLLESCSLSRVMTTLYRPEKMNVAALGNMVPQLHLHHIARFTDDSAWPGPVWGQVPALEYDSVSIKRRVNELREGLLGLNIGFKA